MINLLGKYQNGNYSVKIYSDGTKVRVTDDDEFIPAFAENCDIKITDKCDGGCEFCYEGCTANGSHGKILDYKFLDTLHPYTELAINGNDLSHPELIPFLRKMKDSHIIVNMTVNQIHFEKWYAKIDELISEKLIYGLGVSLRKPTEKFMSIIKTFPNAVIHVINGVFCREDYDILKDNDLKILILGYKQLGRGTDYYNAHMDDIMANQQWLYNELEDMPKHFNVVSFDNLSINQLNVKRLMTESEWDEFYMGDDGDFTFYIDMVDGTFGRNSLSTERYPIADSIDEMFQTIRASVETP